MSGEGALTRLAERGVFVGTCSWTDPTLVEAGTFYPSREMAPADRLAYYAGQFPIVEVDATYYAPPAERTAGLWVERTPPDFTFDVKAFRLLTEHPTPPRSLWKDLAAALPDDLRAKKNLYARDLPREVAGGGLRPLRVGPAAPALGGQAGCGPLPVAPLCGPLTAAPTATCRGRRSAWPSTGWRWSSASSAGWTRPTARPPSPSWRSTTCPTSAWTPRRGSASSMPPVAAATTALAEVRFHGRNAETWEAPGIGAAERFRYDYSAAELQEWVPRVRALAEQAGRVHVLMNNCYADYGVKSARQLAMLLEQAW